MGKSVANFRKCVLIEYLSVGFTTVPTSNRIWFTMSLLGAQIEKFQGGIFIPAEETPIFFCQNQELKYFARQIFLFYMSFLHHVTTTIIQI